MCATLQLTQGIESNRDWECPELLCEKDWDDLDEKRQDPDKIDG
tara:strand:- start:1446 stop:1577 length:132 start_codon:yes stop_codon:yes gene_type:complete